MPAAPAIIAGVAAVGGAYLQKRSADNATKAGLKANDQALAYEREQEAKGEAKAAAYEADRRKQYMAYLKVKNPAMYDSYLASGFLDGGAPATGAPGTVPREDQRRRVPGPLGSAEAGGSYGAAGMVPPDVTAEQWAAQRAGVTPAVARPTIVADGGINTGMGRTLGEMMGGAPRAVPLVETLPGVAGAAPAQGLGGLADYDWRRNIARPQQSMMGGR